jgi:steroid delta-isomerase-like uncharacterized protein
MGRTVDRRFRQVNGPVLRFFPRQVHEVVYQEVVAMTKVQRSVCAAACAITLAFANTTTSRAERRDLAQRWVDAWNAHDADAVAVLFTRDALYEDVAFGSVNHGPDEIRAFAQFFFAAVPDLRVTLVASSLEDGRGTIEWVFSGTDRGVYGTGKTFAVRGVAVLETRGGKISRNSDYEDLATILRQLGLLPAGL